MKHALPTFYLLAFFTLVGTQPVFAADTLADALQENKEVSSFYKAMKDTGVLSDLESGRDYMVFAPINSQFDALLPEADKCMATEACKKALTNLLHNHIVESVVSLKETMQYRAGIFAINGHFIPLNNVGASRFMVEGQGIIESQRLDNGVLYTTNGVLVGDYERSLITAYMQAAAPVIQKSSKVEKTTIPDPACGPEGCPDTKTTITTIKKTVTEVHP